MKKYILFALCIIQLSCNSNNNVTNYKDIITQKGDYTYILFNQTDQKSLTFKIKIVKIENQGYIFGVADSQNNILYQSNIFTTFNTFSKWGIYFDNLTYNIWVYIGDYDSKILLKYVDGKYYENEYYEDDSAIPENFRDWLNR